MFYKLIRDHRCQTKILHLAKFSITLDKERKKFPDRTKFKQDLSINPALQKVLERKLQSKRFITLKEREGINNLRAANQEWRSPHHDKKITGISKHCSLITLNINGLSSPIKTLN